VWMEREIIGHFFLPAAASAALFSSAKTTEKKVRKFQLQFASCQTHPSFASRA